jgi:hypothetical protein
MVKRWACDYWIFGDGYAPCSVKLPHDLQCDKCRRSGRMDERAKHPTPGEDRVRDGRHLMAQPDGEPADIDRDDTRFAPPFSLTPGERREMHNLASAVQLLADLRDARRTSGVGGC